jgi:hypothetical protein
MQRLVRTWAVAIFAARESIETLTACVRSAHTACGSKVAAIDVLVNGNAPLAEQAARIRLKGFDARNVIVRVWSIPVGDKAHAWNEYIHHIWESGQVTYFIDGYAEVRSDALSLLDEGLRSAPDSLGATGVPTSGRSANALRGKLLAEGGIHGNLYAIRGDVISALRQRVFRMPLGLYRTDSLIGAVLMFRLNPVQYDWDTKRVYVHPKATWHVRSSSWWTPKDLISQYRRKLRQAQGVLENRAFRDHLAVKRFSPETLPRSIDELVSRWIADHPRQAKRVFLTQPLTAYAARKLRKPRDWSGSASKSTLLSTIVPDFETSKPD